MNDSLKQSALGGVLGGISVLFVVMLLGNPAIDRAAQSLQGNVNVNAVDVSDIVSEVNPAVVSIRIAREIPTFSEPEIIDPFEDFFGGQSPFRFRTPPQQNGSIERVVGGGSGFFISGDGYIVTNAHVVDAPESVFTVITSEGQELPAEVIAADSLIDIAILKVDTVNASFLEFGPSEEIRLGQGVVAIGNALAEFNNSISTGVISGLSRSIVAGSGAQAELLDNVIQTDAAINPGNSGGPLIDFSGRVIGVNVAVASGSENIGFAIPSNIVKAVVDDILEDGEVDRPFLGVRYQMLNPRLAAEFDVSVTEGAYIHSENDEQAVLAGTPAAEAGLQDGDVITEVDGVAVERGNGLATILRQKRVGDSVTMKIQRGKDVLSVEVTLGEFEG